ncbi:MAG TPA: hypothetical protein VE545_07570, partial [Candidatus Dormibacteraeota bacterium]|nr:hypothetical protein [Candidatus Dormibacteraeota bacterium]
LIAVAVHPTVAVFAAYVGGYAFMRVLMTWLIAIRGMREKGIWQKMPLIPLWDAVAFCIWLVSFTRTRIRWRGIDYIIRDGSLVPPGENK